ncbi:drug/metabolite transporter (DMT)-like permease [Clostridium acetobutylicum]|uniref:Predicted permease n=1 Tax=Clostridium acetobutylicum (strain ATCC 824 / DSM 792 / JCM 1419 / IAM 19013 / LMG 5710 / NBRC 13948 / NRRL B-527 / VKM B-1787 / 2291 / W) TaxID=272562 RepID=Q97FF8_CLOAB|nr:MULTISPECIES: DMT family transporter [Clostridium]AAK80726.1 Predicted permease [Clostridium acetobutylicum ATCC 824]ADZ21827.1 permease [Clostridium acetobutylicum EA 2018]AEI32546.1 permease [Clostridium acetobutylicum DSM 1731]AWV78860.1 DMT family transporter [Clostridium acetobutylicum]MBC2395097.1 DMT family transporter [Clostridium acetobutylicum]
MNSKKIFTDKKLVVLFASICCFLWGSAYPGVKIGYKLFNIKSNDVPSEFVFAGYRFALAGIMVIIISIILHRNMKIFNKKNIVQIFVLGITQTLLQYIFFYVGLGYTTGTKGSIMNSTGTFFSIILANFIYKNDKLNINKIIGCIIGFIGVIVANFNSDILKFSFSFKGEGFIMAAAFVLSVSSIYGKRITQKLDSMIVTGYQLFIGGAFLAVLGFFNGGHLTGFHVESISLLVYLAVLSATAFSLWAALLKYNKVGIISAFNFLIPIFGVLLSGIFLKENILQLKNLAALILVCFGIVLVYIEKPTANN